MEHSPYDLPFSDLEFSVLDLETTGLDPSKDRILQIGVVPLGPGPLRSLGWETKVHPGRGRPVPSAILDLTGLDVAELLGARPIGACLRELSLHLSGTVLAGHNLGRFDLRFLLCAAEKAGVDLPVLPIVDTLLISRRLRPWQDDHRLAACVASYGLRPPPGHAHDALYDARATASLLAAQLHELRARGIDSLGELARFLTGYDRHEKVAHR